MLPLTFDSISFLRDQERIFFVGGEIHYFRMPPDQWAQRLRLLKEAGGNCVCTYVPWLLHEPEEGKFVLDDPALDINRFLKLCAELELWAVVRPGPYQYSELLNAGLPSWLLKNYPQVNACGIDGSPLVWPNGMFISVSYQHPDFLRLTQRWYEQILPILAAHQIDRGGAVVAAQIDNELMGVHAWLGSWDYHPEVMGIGREGGRWPQFVQQRYGDLAGVNEAYELQAGSMAEVLPLAESQATSLAQLRRVMDYRAFYFEQVAQYARTLVQWMRENEITVPLVHNCASPYMTGYFRETVERCRGELLLGSDHYYNLDLDWDQNQPSPKYASKCLMSMELLRGYGFPPAVFEMPSGSLSDWPPITPSDAACAYGLNLAVGMKGVNYYVFAGGANPAGTGTTCDLYDYGAPVSPTGEIRPLYEAVAGFNRLLDQQRWLAGAEAVSDCRIGYCLDQSRYPLKLPVDQKLLMPPSEAWSFMRKGLMLTSLCAHWSPEMVDLSSDGILDDMTRPLLVAGSTVMAAGEQRRLVQYLQAGGQLILAPVVPTLDEHYRPCRILADYLGGVEQQRCRRDAPLIRVGEIGGVLINGGLFEFTHLPAGAQVIARTQLEPAAVGLKINPPGGGCAVVLGFHWRQSRREHERVVHQLLLQAGGQPAIECDNPNLWALARTDGQQTMLFILNLFSSPMSASIRFRDCVHQNQWQTLPPIKLGAMEVQAWSPAGCIWRSSAASGDSGVSA